MLHFIRNRIVRLCDEAEVNDEACTRRLPIYVDRNRYSTDDEIHEKYMLMVPVIEKDGDVLLYGNIGYVDLVELF